MRTVHWAVAVAVSAVSVTLSSAVPAAAVDEPDVPDAYQDDLPGTPEVIGSPTSVSVFLGAGTRRSASSGEDPVRVTSVAEFESAVSSPSPALGAGVEQFFAQGGTTALVSTVDTENPASLVEALASLTPSTDSEWDLVVVPALGGLSGDGYTQVVVALASAASRAKGTALVDPPDDVVAVAQESGAGPLSDLAASLRLAVSDPGRVVLYSSALRNGDGEQVAAAPVMAGLTARTDTEAGVWKAPGGVGARAKGLRPELLVDNAMQATLNPTGVDVWRVVPGYGTAMWGAHTLAMEGPAEYVAEQRTLSFIDRSVTAAMADAAFESNDAAAWESATLMTDRFLNGLWKEGALFGTSAEEAYSVKVGVGSSMTPTDVADGTMRINLGVAVTMPGEFVQLRVIQKVGG